MALKRELEDGLERWSKQVLEVQENNMRRGLDQVNDNKKLRRQRSREERRSRERREMKRRKDSKEREDKDLKIKRMAIEEKERKVTVKFELHILCRHLFFKVETILKEREQSKERQRRLTARTAGLRRTMRY